MVMGLPRYLAKRFDGVKNGTDKCLFFWSAFYANETPCLGHCEDDPKTDFDDALKFGLKRCFGFPARPHNFESMYSNLNLKLVEEMKYIALTQDSAGNYRWTSEPTLIQYRYCMKYRTKRETRIKDEIRLARKRDELESYRRIVYSSRQFPPKLKAVIFDRDSYTCQLCGRNLDTLKSMGLHLECDHIRAWEDGGRTSYKNGQTLCSECNKAKHAAKHYLATLVELKVATGR
jgi:5-methylcytosine-specific restriction endonuclease McrA